MLSHWNLVIRHWRNTLNHQRLYVLDFDAFQSAIDDILQVRELDWVSNAWPKYWLDIQAQYQTHLKQEHMYYPKTRK